MTLVFRPYRHTDYPALVSIVKDTWRYDEMASPKVAALLAEVFVSSCLCNATHSIVAQADGDVAGVILLKDIARHRCSWNDRWRQISALTRLLLRGEGRKVMGVFRNVSCVDAQLLGEIDTAYRGEIALFVLDGKYRGRGLGKALYDRAEAYLRAHALMPFYLFTDTSCNYRFYERQGLRRRAQHEEVVCVAERKQRMGFFVYEGNDSLCGSAAA
ncbi:GNAT family N-acetyltransferase [Bifidobacterium pseudolongum]|uniref:GNAT family N-acetyltransferase n=1 Tax=Bifidobacterium pseudolongum TaxID=1694 RepID=UPI001F0FDC22|nr:GNAT family N-acetyltransferase [Bifidobacterium pseudolongum]MCH4852421.1 GNAT family N-acetyltransferase [Bifidobacterium pseudolongum]